MVKIKIKQRPNVGTIETHPGIEVEFMSASHKAI